MRLCVQEFMSDQAATLAKVSDYCSATNLSRAVDPYVYSYDKSRQFLYCRNHKVSSSNKNQVALFCKTVILSCEPCRLHLTP